MLVKKERLQSGRSDRAKEGTKTVEVNEPSMRASAARGIHGLIRLRNGRCPIISGNLQYACNEPRRWRSHALALTKDAPRVAAAVRKLG